MLLQLKQKWNSIPVTVKSSAAYMACSILQRCISFFTLPLFTRLLSQEEYGIYTVYNSWMGILAIFLTLNLAYGSLSTAMIKFEAFRDRYISSIQGIGLMLSVLFLCVYLPFSAFWQKVFGLPAWMVVMMVFEIQCNFAILLWSGKKRFEFKYKGVIALTLCTSFFAPLLAYILVSLFDQKGYARIVGFSTVFILAGGAMFLFNLKKGKTLFDKKYWKYALSFNVPLIVYYLSQNIFNYSDRIMIDNYLGTGQAGLYDVACNLAMAMTFVITSVNNSYVPWFFNKLKEDKGKENIPVAGALSLVIALGICGVVWIAPEIMNIMAGADYAPGVWVIPPVALSLLLSWYAQLFLNTEFYFEDKKALIYASIGSALVNIALNALFIPVFGVIAAGYTTLASFALFALCNYIGMRHVAQKNGMDWHVYGLKNLIGIFAAAALICVLGMFLYGHFRIRMAILILAAAGALLAHKKLAAQVSRFMKEMKVR